MKRLLTLIPMLALFTAIFASGAAAQTPASATMQLIGDAETLTVGDPLTFELAVQHLDGTQAVFPQLDAQWGDFEVTSQSATEISGAEAGMVTTSQQINATAFAPGAFAPPAVSVAIYDSGGNVTEVSAESQPITINSVLIEGDTELRDIKPQATVGLVPLWTWVVVGALLLVGVIVFAIYRRRNGRTQPQLPPYEEAIAALDAIAARDLPLSGAFKEYYTLVTDSLRRYINRRYELPVMELTTDEVRKTLKDSDVPQSEATRLTNMLSDADLVKFAKVTPDIESANQLMRDANLFVEATKPVVEEKETKSGSTTPPNQNQKIEVMA
jgi:hypothetical protein